MSKITKKNKRRVLIYSMLIIIILAYLCVFSYNYWSVIFQNKKEKALLEEEYASLLEKEEKLNNEVTKLQDPDYVAKYARKKYNLSKEDEIIIKIDED